MRSEAFALATHLPFSLLSPGKHQLMPCFSCHVMTVPNRKYGLDYQRFDCLTCHLQPDLAPTHDHLTGYAFDSPTCTRGGCHENGAKP